MVLLLPFKWKGNTGLATKKKIAFEYSWEFMTKNQKNTFRRDNETKTNDSVKTKNDIIASGPSGKVHLV